MSDFFDMMRALTTDSSDRFRAMRDHAKAIQRNARVAVGMVRQAATKTLEGVADGITHAQDAWQKARR